MNDNWNNSISPKRDFVAIDIENADRQQNICQVGLAVVRDLKVVSSRSWLIQPPGNYYEDLQIRIHGIRPEMTVYAPTLEQIWPEIDEYLDGQQLWAHNATSVEGPVLDKNLAHYGIDKHYTVLDSRDLCQRPDCPPNKGNGLVQCCMAFGIPHEHHHDAERDAVMCAQVVVACAEGRVPIWDGVPVTQETLRKSEQEKRVLRLGDFTDYYNSTSSGEEDVFAVLTSTYEGAQEQEVDVFDKGDQLPKEKDGMVDIARLKMGEGSVLNGKKVVITGAFSISRKEIERAITAMGAKKISNPTKNADAIIIGPVNVSYGKLTALEEQEAKGHHIARIVGDQDLEELLYGDGGKFFS